MHSMISIHDNGREPLIITICKSIARGLVTIYQITNLNSKFALIYLSTYCKKQYHCKGKVDLSIYIYHMKTT